MGKISFCKLTQAQYDDLAAPDPETVYFLTDSRILVLGGREYVHKIKAEKFLVNRVFADDVYGTAAWLDADNSMELAGYFAVPVNQFDLWIVSANPKISGNIVLSIGDESFTVPVTGTVRHVVLTPAQGVSGRISIVRDAAGSADTLKDGTDVITALVVDWRYS